MSLDTPRDGGFGICVPLGVLAIALLTGCGARERVVSGTVEVTITLSRNGGGLGPTFDHVPQRGRDVTMTSAAGRDWSATTDGEGMARFEVPPGSYAVTHSSCSAVSGPFRVRVGATTPVEVDCVAP